jgi:hypothetical protein
VEVGFFAVHPRAVVDSLEKSVIILFTKWLNQLTDTAIQHPDLGSVPASSDTGVADKAVLNKIWKNV